MKNITTLRQEIAKMRLIDLVEEYGHKSQRVVKYMQRMGNLINEEAKEEWSDSPKKKDKRLVH